MTSHPDGTLELAARLRRDDLARSPAYEGPPAAVEFHRGMLARSAHLSVLEGPHGARAMVARLEADVPAHGVGTTHLLMHRRRADPEALAWVVSHLPDVLADARHTPSVMLPADELDLRLHLLRAGLRIQHVTQVGRVDEALGRLRAAAFEPLPEGLRWVDMAPEHADAVADLKVEAFSDGRFAFFGAGAGFRQQARAAVLSPRPFSGRRQVLEDDQGAAGLVELHHRLDDAHNTGGSAGVDIVLAPRLRGRGLTWPIYRYLLQSLQSDGIAWLKGATAQPAIMRVGRQLGRVVTAMTLRRDAPFDEAWFVAHLPELPHTG